MLSLLRTEVLDPHQARILERIKVLAASSTVALTGLLLMAVHHSA